MIQSTHSVIVDPKVTAQSTLCHKITNKNTGRTFYRNSEPTSKWEILFQEAKFNSGLFEFHYDGDHGEEKTKLNYVYSHAELMTLSMPALRDIGKPFEVTSNSKDVLIEKILLAQETGVKSLEAAVNDILTAGM
jgi:hypothetical protein